MRTISTTARPLYLACTVLLSLLPLQASAQQQPQPTLKQLLAGINQTYSAYLRTVPNLYADENLFSAVTFPRMQPVVTTPGQPNNGENQHVTYDSIYRLRRINDHELGETRQVVSVDRHPATPEQKVVAPNLVINPQSAPNVFSPALAQCFDYKLQPNRKWQGKTVWVVSYASARRTGGLQARCPIHEAVSGRAFIDPASMQLVRFEETRPRHTLETTVIQNMHLPSEDSGLWKWSMDFTTVILEDRPLNLPKAITSTFEIFRSVRWSVQSSFTHYQLADVHSKILLPDGSPLPHQ